MRTSGLTLALSALMICSCSEEAGFTQRAANATVTIYEQGQSYEDANEATLAIRLGRVPVYATEWAIYQVENRGEVELAISEISYNEGQVQGRLWREPVWIRHGAVTDASRPLSHDASSGAVTVPRFGKLLVGFAYSPVEEGSHTATATIHSDAGNGNAIELSIQGEAYVDGYPDLEVRYNDIAGPEPQECQEGHCVIAPERALNFGNIGLGTQGTVRLTLRNTAECNPPEGVDPCSVCALTVDKNAEQLSIGFGFKPGTNSDGCLDAAGEPTGCFAFAGSTATPFSILQENHTAPCSEGGAITPLLTFNAPEQEGNFTATVVVESNDPDEPLLEVPIRAAARNAPTAVANFRELDPDNPSAPWTNPDEIRPLHRVYFDGRKSFDPLDPDDPSLITGYEWMVLEHPTGLNREDFDPLGANTGLYSFWLPLAGRYVVQLRVTNNAGVQSGDTESSIVEFESVPESKLHVQLTWEHPENDQDLHLLHVDESETICDSIYDCYFYNKTPVWFSGTMATEGPNPRLDIDDTDGLGPENINIDEPEPGVYRVAVHYWRPKGEGELTRNRVRIFLNGLQVAEYRRTLSPETLWTIADIFWLSDGSGYVAAMPPDAEGEVGRVEPLLREGSGCMNSY